jgi:prepilin signal peptidase PulO-like enzyme (type II secretory pathway)
MFNLDQAVAEWRCRMLAAGIKTPVPLDELEIHLRDDVEQQVRSGSDAQQAFEAAVVRIGQPAALKREFTKVGQPWHVLQRKMVWALIGVAFLSCWIGFGQSPGVALIYGVLLAGLIVATFIDFKHFIIPDEITIGGILAGFLCSFLLPQLHGQKLLIAGALQSLFGIGVGAGLVYLVLRVGKLLFGRQRITLSGDTNITFTDSALVLPDKEIPYEELFYRKSDAIELHARMVKLGERSYQDVSLRLTPSSLDIGDEKFNSEDVSRIEATGTEIVLPREAMGFGDVKFRAAIGAFLGWQAVLFSLVASSLIGSLVGVGLIAARRREWSSRLPYGPYIALAATIWIFFGKQILEVLFMR